MNEIIDTKNVTPIEMALGVDENGMTTAKKLYEFLELDNKNYSRWCKTNIIENEFATENEDYWVFFMNDENPLGGRPTQDFKLTAHFAKKLSCKGGGEKAELAREYFTTIEEKAKELAINRSALSPELQMFLKMGEAMAKQEIEQKRLAGQIEAHEKAIDGIKEAVMPVTDNWREEMQKKFNRIQRSYGIDFRSLWSEMYAELDRRAGADIGTRLRNRKERMRNDGYTKTAVNNLNKMDIIESDKRLREIFSKIMTEYEIRYCA